MKPFKFFFALSLGVMFFFFIARFVVAAFVIAAVMSVVFFIGRKIGNFLRTLAWNGHYKREWEYAKNQYRSSELPFWKEEFDLNQGNRQRMYEPSYRAIKID